MAACELETVFQLPACAGGADETYALHDALYEACGYLLEHNLCEVPYLYRTDYLPDYVTGNDVVALTVIAAAARERGVRLPGVLRCMARHDPGAPVTPDDVTYAADNAGALADAVGAVMGRIAGADRWCWLRGLAWYSFAAGLLVGVFSAPGEEQIP